MCGTAQVFRFLLSGTVINRFRLNCQLAMMSLVPNFFSSSKASIFLFLPLVISDAEAAFSLPSKSASITVGWLTSLSFLVD
jgi:hypothetical protein